jgi:sulfur relay (sulfurtransferase) complex TusBCD TusD component (DsrE family)
MGRTLAIVVTTAPAHGDFGRAVALAHAARQANIDVGLFLMDAAATLAGDARAATLVEEGCEVIVCATNLGSLTAAPGVVVGSQDDHAALVSRADRVVAFS